MLAMTLRIFEWIVIDIMTSLGNCIARKYSHALDIHILDTNGSFNSATNIYTGLKFQHIKSSTLP